MDPFNARFRDRQDGGRALARRLLHYAGRRDVVVVALPRGGVVTASEVASHLLAPLDVLVLRRIFVPGHADLAMGAVGPHGLIVTHRQLVRDLVISASELSHAAEREMPEQRRRESLLRGDRPQMQLARKVVILADDGIATGSSMRWAIAAVRLMAPARIVVAAPVIAAATMPLIQHEADEVVCVMTGEPFAAVSTWYDVYEPVTDADVRFILDTPVGGDGRTVEWVEAGSRK